ncbi:hypothetical protein E2562_021158 [Oryza meyeriana var. granulata]|uniref:Uncharacterized protein n=1 Tax=Oryza meyeriana var. granulata TaxID=110450 RepID=A0A6G1DYR1_9ORYZ|nr:hypothetical protein E2562_021158 [Oryza meyeriana var. granulata]
MPPNGGETASKPQSPLRITHDGEFYARLLTKESSQGNPSFRYYGAGTGAVPFVWESHPGTPKVDATSSSCRMLAAAAGVPAITPPPSYHLRAAAVSSHGHSGRVNGRGRSSSKYCGYYKLKWIKIGFIAAVFRRLALGKSRASSSSSVQPSPSTRWLFSGSGSVVTSDEQAPAPAPATKGGGFLCLGVRPSPWMVQFCGGRSIRMVDTGSWATDGWA